MRDIVADLFLILFGASIFFTYLTIRFGWLKLLAATVLGLITSVLFMFLFSVFKGNNVLQAITVAGGLGFLFTVTSVSIAAFFQVNMAVMPKVTKPSASANPADVKTHKGDHA